MSIRLTRARVFFAVALGAVLTAGGVAYATIPDANGVLTACMHKSTGALRLIDPSDINSGRLSNMLACFLAMLATRRVLH